MRGRLTYQIGGVNPPAAEFCNNADQLPKFAVKNGVIYAAGFCGSGVVWARWMGQKAAGQILAQDGGTYTFDAPFWAIPFYNGRPWFLPGMIAWYNFLDWRADIKK